MVINSEAFTLWKDHFRRLEGVVPAWPESTLVTVGAHLDVLSGEFLGAIDMQTTPVLSFSRRKTHFFLRFPHPDTDS